MKKPQIQAMGTVRYFLTLYSHYTGFLLLSIVQFLSEVLEGFEIKGTDLYRSILLLVIKKAPIRTAIHITPLKIPDLVGVGSGL